MALTQSTKNFGQFDRHRGRNGHANAGAAAAILKFDHRFISFDRRHCRTGEADCNRRAGSNRIYVDPETDLFPKSRTNLKFATTDIRTEDRFIQSSF